MLYERSSTVFDGEDARRPGARACVGGSRARRNHGAADGLTFDSDDVAVIQDFFTQAYSKTTIRSDPGESTATHVERQWYGPINFDRLDVGFHMSYDAAPMHRVCLSQVRAGTIEEEVAGYGRDVLAPGDVALFCQPDVPYSGRVCNAGYDLTIFDVELLDRLAGLDDEQVQLLGHRPVSEEAERHIRATLDYVRSLAFDGTPVTRLVASTTASMLAGAVLSAFPNTASRPDSTAVKTDTRPVMLRRAIAFIEDNADSPIVLSDVAASVHVTPRALQYMFKRHLDMTPMAYLRRVRLDHAHHDLVDADPADTTVQHIAARWGFAHTGRFAAMYRQTYGCMPSDTLRY